MDDDLGILLPAGYALKPEAWFYGNPKETIMRKFPLNVSSEVVAFFDSVDKLYYLVLLGSV